MLYKFIFIICKKRFGFTAEPLLFFLFKILYAAFENFHIKVAVEVFIQVLAFSLTVPHFAEHSAVRRSNAFNGINRAVRVKRTLHCGIPVKVYVLRSDLPVFDERFQVLVVADKPALSVRDCNVIRVAHFYAFKPRRKVACNARLCYF